MFQIFYQSQLDHNTQTVFLAGTSSSIISKYHLTNFFFWTFILNEIIYFSFIFNAQVND